MRTLLLLLLLASPAFGQTGVIPKTGAAQIVVDNYDDPVTSTRPLPVMATVNPYLELKEMNGVAVSHKFGYVKAIDAADAATDVWAWGSDTVTGSALKTWPSVAATLYVASSSSSDTDLDITTYYIDANGYEKSVTVNTNGKNSVSLGVTALDVNRAYISNANAAVGNIHICNTNSFTSGVPNTPADVLAYIPVGYAQTEQATYRVPIDKTLVINRMIVVIGRASGADGSAEVELIMKNVGGTWRVLRTWFITTAITLNVEESGLVFSGGTQVRLNLEDVSDTDTNCTGVWHGFLIRN